MKRGKCLALAAVLAMVVCAFTVTVPANADAEGTGDATTVTPSIAFENINANYYANGTWNNSGVTGEGLGNNIIVSYDADSKTYTVSGTLSKIKYELPDTDYSECTTAAQKASYILYTTLNGGTADIGKYTASTAPSYMLPFQVAKEEDQIVVIGEKEDTGDTDTTKSTWIKYITGTSGEINVKIMDTSKTTTAAEFTIAYNFTLSSSFNSTTGYTVVEDSNALDISTIRKGTDGADGKWELSDDGRILTLTNYNGKEFFGGGNSLETVVLVGENTITLDNAPKALDSSALKKIYSIEGTGSLDIKRTGDSGEFEAISTAASDGLEINGVSISVDVAENPDRVYGINAFAQDTCGGVTIYDAKISISVPGETDTNKYETFKIGIYSNGPVSIRSSDIDITSGYRGINTDHNTAGEGDVEIAASTVDIVASQKGINVRLGTLTVTNMSVVSVQLDGEIEANAYGVHCRTGLSVQSDSVLSTDGIWLEGTSAEASNSATIVNNGDMLIASDATFNNAGTFINNGLVGIYGAFNSTAGTVQNAGTMATYGFKLGTISSPYVTVDSYKFEISGWTLQADGTISVIATVSGGSDTAAAGTYFSTLSVLSVETNAMKKYSVVGVTDDNEKSMSLSYDGSKYSYAFSTSSKDDQDGTDSNLLACVEKTDKSTISVSGGVFTNEGAMTIEATSDEFLTDGEFVNSGVLAVNANVTMTGGKLTGNNAYVSEGATVVLTGTVDMGFEYAGDYKDAAGKTVSFDDAVDVSGPATGFTLKADSNGVFAISGLGATASESIVTVLEGTSTISDAIEANVILAVEDGATLRVASKGATATAGVIAVEDGAVFQMKVTGEKETFSYGTLTYTIAFENDGYTYYGSLQFALANAAEGAVLVLKEKTKDAEITATTAVKDGITLVIGKDSVLTVSGTADAKTVLTMGEGASFVLYDGAKVVIKATNVTASGTFSYDDSVIVLDAAVFSADATISGKAETKTAESSIDLSTEGVSAGKVVASEGNITGSIVLTEESAMTVDAEAACVLTKFTDAAKTTLTVNGDFGVTGAQAFNGKVTGLGDLVLANKAIVTFAATATADVRAINTELSSAVDFDSVTAKTSGSEEITIEAKAGTSAATGYLIIGGNINAGTVTIDGSVSITTATVQKNAIVIVPAETFLSVEKGKTVNAIGLVKVAGTLNKGGDDYGTLTFEITYSEGSYTVYTYLSTGVNNAQAGQSFTVEQNLDIDADMTVPAGVTITIADGKTLTVKTGKHIIIGTAATSLGATTGISGTIVLAGSAFVVVYADSAVDMSKAEIVTGTAGNYVDAAESQFTVLRSLYATVYVGTETASGVGNLLKPSIEGYRFVKWLDLDEGTYQDSNVGTIDFVATMNPAEVKVTFKQVDGISYYVDNKKQNTVGAPVYLSYGSTITAVADYGYEGTPLVNGKAYITVTDSLTEVVGSGVTAISIDTNSQKDSTLTDALLIVLVVLIAIMAIMVALKLMRS